MMICAWSGGDLTDRLQHSTKREAAVPGVVDAAMNRDGLPSMRSSITYKEEVSQHVRVEGVVCLKPFNMVMDDLGESFLRRAVYVESIALADHLSRLSAGRGEFQDILLNVQLITGDGLLEYLSGCRRGFDSRRPDGLP